MSQLVLLITFSCMPSPLVEKFMYPTPLRIYIYSHQFSPSTHKQPDYQNFHFYFFTLTASLLLQETRTKKKRLGMGFLELLEVASMPIVQVLLISVLGAFLATDYCSLLSADTRRSVNKVTSIFAFLFSYYHAFIISYIYISSLINIFRCTQLVFVVFTPCIMFANLAQTVTLQDIISWYALPIFTHRYEKTCGFDLSKISFAGGLCP